MAASELDAIYGDAVMVVRDNGRGVRVEEVGVNLEEGRGYGLYSIRERVSLLGGRLPRGSDAAGTRATVRVPLTASVGEGHKDAGNSIR